MDSLGAGTAVRIFHLDHDRNLLVLFVVEILTFLDRNDALFRNNKAAARILDQGKLQQGINIVKVGIDSLQRIDHRPRLRVFENARRIGQYVGDFIHVLDMNHDRIEYRKRSVVAVPQKDNQLIGRIAIVIQFHFVIENLIGPDDATGVDAEESRITTDGNKHIVPEFESLVDIVIFEGIDNRSRRHVFVDCRIRSRMYGNRHFVDINNVNVQRSLYRMRAFGTILVL